MKNFKLTILGVVTLLIALTLNFRHALDDYGISKNKLHVEVLAQSNGSGGSSSGGGDSSGGGSSGGEKSGNVQSTPVHCTINGILTHKSSSSNSSGSAWEFNGKIHAGKGPFKLDLGGGYGENSDGSSSNYGFGSVNVYEDFHALKYICPRQTYNACTPFDPCIETLKQYRSII